jgi:hypothetical protein
VADGEAVQTQMTLLGNTDEPGFSANRRQATGMHVACYDSDIAELTSKQTSFCDFNPATCMLRNLCVDNAWLLCHLLDMECLYMMRESLYGNDSIFVLTA